MTILGNIPPDDELTAVDHATPAGLVLPYSGNSAASGADAIVTALPGWLYCRGQTVSEATYPKLAAVFGSTAPAGMVHAFNGGTSPGAGLVRVPNLQRALPLHKAASGQGSALGSAAGGAAQGSGWSHGHSINTLAIAGHSHTAGSLTMPNHSHPHNLYEGGHTHGINSATGDYWGTGTATNVALDQTTDGGHWVNDDPYFKGTFPTDGGGVVSRQLQSLGAMGLTGTAIDPTAGVAGPHLFVNYIIKAG